VAAIHDLSCFGRCALTVVLPALSAQGIQAIPVPTALLSTHTGGFESPYFLDLTDSMPKIFDHFAELGLTFDAIYTGFLGSEEQIDIVSDFIARFADNDTLVMVDPVMGDDGELYSTYTPAMRERMYELCHHAHVITPNLTEACFLAGVDYSSVGSLEAPEALRLCDSLSSRLLEFGCQDIVITGVPHGEKSFGTYGRRAGASAGYMYSVERVCRSYPGTGDLFASVLLGRLLSGTEFEEALRYSSDLICRVMRYTSQFATPLRDGVAFEAFLCELSREG
jgi:pyridoxine kinase